MSSQPSGEYLLDKKGKTPLIKMRSKVIYLPCLVKNFSRNATKILTKKEIIILTFIK